MSVNFSLVLFFFSISTLVYIHICCQNGLLLNSVCPEVHIHTREGCSKKHLDINPVVDPCLTEIFLS